MYTSSACAVARSQRCGSHPGARAAARSAARFARGAIAHPARSPLNADVSLTAPTSVPSQGSGRCRVRANGPAGVSLGRIGSRPFQATESGYERDVRRSRLPEPERRASVARTSVGGRTDPVRHPPGPPSIPWTLLRLRLSELMGGRGTLGREREPGTPRRLSLARVPGWWPRNEGVVAGCLGVA